MQFSQVAGPEKGLLYFQKYLGWLEFIVKKNQKSLTWLGVLSQLLSCGLKL
jgi:hypothetical protein